MIRLMRDSLSPDRPASCAWSPRGPYSNRMATNATASDACIPKHRLVTDRTPFARPHRARAMRAGERTINRLGLNWVRRWLAASKTVLAQFRFWQTGCAPQILTSSRTYEQSLRLLRAANQQAGATGVSGEQRRMRRLVMVPRSRPSGSLTCGTPAMNPPNVGCCASANGSG
jgi:hypothetical protein